MAIVLGVLEEGLVFAIMALGVYITYKILDFPDLSVDGTFPLGGAVTVLLIVNGAPPILTLLAATLAGAAAGAITGLIHVKLKVRDLLSGIITMTALYSINLRVAGSANVAIFSKDSIFENDFLSDVVPDAVQPYITLIILFITVIVVKLILDKFLKTRSGYLLRAVGDNDVLVTSLAKDKGAAKILGLVIANAFAALAGCVYCQMNGFFEISSGTGTIVIGLASVIIGTSLFKDVKKAKRSGFHIASLKPTTAVVLGAVLYKACVSIAIALGLPASDLKAITAVLFLGILVFSNLQKRKVKGNA